MNRLSKFTFSENETML